MDLKFSQELRTVFSYARDEAMRTGHRAVQPDHLVLAMLRHSDNDACRILSEAGVDLRELKDSIDARIFLDPPIPYYDLDLIRPSKSTLGIIGSAAYEALRMGSSRVTPAHVLLALAKTGAEACPIGAEVISEMLQKSSSTMRKDNPSVRMEDLMGTLGEQLGRLFDSPNLYS